MVARTEPDFYRLAVDSPYPEEEWRRAWNIVAQHRNHEELWRLVLQHSGSFRPWSLAQAMSQLIHSGQPL